MTEARHAAPMTAAENFNLIREANKAIQTTTITRTDKQTGAVIVKEYAQVNERVKAFRMVHPLGTISTKIISLENGVVTMQTEILDEDGRLLATGFAQEKETSSFINKTSFIENCETSAVGRALGMCGFGIDTSICSFEELQNAMKNQGESLDDLMKQAIEERRKLAELYAKLGQDIHSDQVTNYLLKKANTETADPAGITEKEAMKRLIKVFIAQQKACNKKLGEMMINDRTETF